MKLQALILAYSIVALAGCGTNSDRDNGSEESPVVFRSTDGRELTLADLSEATGTFEYKIVNADQIPDEANSLHQKARQLGAAGEYESAIQTLTKAQALAPDWPYPTYDMAFTYLLMKDFDKARECYRKTVKMSPRGFFTAITALDALDRELSGDLPAGTYLAYMSLEWVSDPVQKASVVSQMTKKLPTYAPVWKEFALQCDDPVAKLAAIESGLACNPDLETEGMLLINKALTLNDQGDSDTAKSILGDLALNPKTSFANEHLAKQTLDFISH